MATTNTFQSMGGNFKEIYAKVTKSEKPKYEFKKLKASFKKPYAKGKKI